MENKNPIVFYDGDCGFCNKTVQFLLRNEKSKIITFAALQSDFAKHFFVDNNFDTPDLSTFYYWDGSKLFSKSAGALKLLNQLKNRFQILKIGYLIPTKIRDKVYDFVANRRHKISNGFCVIPSAEDKSRFIK